MEESVDVAVDEQIGWVVSAGDSSAKDAGKVSKQESVLPEGITITKGPVGKDESDLLIDGDVDALFHAGEPKAFVDGKKKKQCEGAGICVSEADQSSPVAASIQ